MGTRSIASLLAVISLSAALASTDEFIPAFSKERILSPDWFSVYTHLPELVQMTVEQVEGQPFKTAAAFITTETAPANVAGKASYFRSRAFQIGSDKFAVEWSVNVVKHLVGPQFELWGEVGANPNEFDRLLLRLNLKGDSLVVDSNPVASIRPGWQRVKVVVSVATNTFDLYCGDMASPVASQLPLMTEATGTDRLGLGFVLYLNPGAPPAKWQIGGVSASAL